MNQPVVSPHIYIRTFEELEQLVSQWATLKGIYAQGTPLAQADKTLEEAQEIRDAIVDNDQDEIADGIGDTLVTLIIQARMQNMDILECLSGAYDIISKRTGKMVSGQFVKDE